METRILPLQRISQAEANRIITGYTCTQRYAAARLESETQTIFSLAVAEPRRWNRSLWVWELDVESFEVAIFL